MKAQVKSIKDIVDVSLYYLHGRIVDCAGDDVAEWIDFDGKQASIPD